MFVFVFCGLKYIGFIKCIDFFEDNKYYYFVMEYGGESLFDFVTDNVNIINKYKYYKKAWKLKVKMLFKQMCLYIKWLHKNGVCHLDLSLENCLIKDNIVYFIDFGLSEYFGRKTGNKITYNFNCIKYCGKPMYQSPEVLFMCYGYMYRYNIYYLFYFRYIKQVRINHMMVEWLIYGV